VVDHHLEPEQRVSPLELFFDLVFVFGFTQVTTVLSDNSTWSGLGHALLLVGALWWAWAAYAWLTNAFDPSESAVWGTMLVATAAMSVAALVPVALVVPALVVLALGASVWVALHAYELIWWREARAQTRAGRAPAPAS
jgi:low temperature requirement protein LtrA